MRFECRKRLARVEHMYHTHMHFKKMSSRQRDFTVFFCSDRTFSSAAWDVLKLQWDVENAFNFSIKAIRHHSDWHDYFKILVKDALKEIINGTYCKRAIVSIDARGSNTYHFLTENLPDIINLHTQALTKWNSNQFEILIGEEAIFMRQYFKLCGIKNRVRSVYDKGIAVQSSLSSEHHFAKTNLLAENILRIQEALSSVYESIDEEQTTGCKIFIERRSGSPHHPLALARHIYPLNKVHSWMIENGFRVIYLEDLDVVEQIKLFRSASIVCGMHGAGLVNMIHSRPGTKVIEITHINSQNNVFEEVANACPGIEFSKLGLRGILSAEEEINVVENNQMCGWHNLPLKFKSTAFVNSLLCQRSFGGH